MAIRESFWRQDWKREIGRPVGKRLKLAAGLRKGDSPEDKTVDGREDWDGPEAEMGQEKGT